ncbi:hypothetical protein RIF29_21877 [Crotalaria pallida]|uniref:Uncharacterized protein n=1 Tax=Crotalaria pallida TaxID=3830 RepID=A0AAN9F7P7_CROPI
MDLRRFFSIAVKGGHKRFHTIFMVCFLFIVLKEKKTKIFINFGPSIFFHRLTLTIVQIPPPPPKTL